MALGGAGVDPGLLRIHLGLQEGYCTKLYMEVHMCIMFNNFACRRSGGGGTEPLTDEIGTPPPRPQLEPQITSLEQYIII